MKKVLASFLVSLLFGMNFLPAFAASNCIKDVKSNYWATKEIHFVVGRSIMTVNEKRCFEPENSVSRVDFVQSLLKILSNDNLNIKIKNSFTDVNTSDSFYNDVLRSEQLGLVYGYPDKTFKPNQNLLRSEVTSIISHITKNTVTDTSVLKQFSDKSQIPAWAKNSYTKAITYGLYVNHPLRDALEPNRELTRAEAAVLLYKLYNKLYLVKDQYKNTAEKIKGVEHLNVSDKAPCHNVTVTNLRKIVAKDNVLRISYDQKYWSKKSHAGDLVKFVFKDGVYTEEGTLLIPQNSSIMAEVTKIEKPKWLNKNARVSMKFRELTMADTGKVYKIDADPFTKDRKLKEGPWMTFWKVFGWTTGVGAVATGAGVGFSFISTPARIGTGIAIATPIGCTVGLILGLVTPGLHYKAKKGENILIILNDATSLYNN